MYLLAKYTNLSEEKSPRCERVLFKAEKKNKAF